MRRRLYGSLAALLTVGAAVVVVTEVTEGHCTIVCDWQVLLAVLGVGAMLGAVVLAGVAVFYEVAGPLRRRRERR